MLLAMVSQERPSFEPVSHQHLLVSKALKLHTAFCATD
jgi:hypothetical protein